MNLTETPTYETEEWVNDAIRAGAVGYLLKDIPRTNLIRAIEAAYAGQIFLDPVVAGKIIAKVANSGRQTDTALGIDLILSELESISLNMDRRTQNTPFRYIF